MLWVIKEEKDAYVIGEIEKREKEGWKRRRGEKNGKSKGEGIWVFNPRC